MAEALLRCFKIRYGPSFESGWKDVEFDRRIWQPNDGEIGPVDDDREHDYRMAREDLKVAALRLDISRRLSAKALRSEQVGDAKQLWDRLYLIKGDLRSADLRGANLKKAELGRAKLESAKLWNAQVDAETDWEQAD